jgi:hypothetical protein
MIDENEYESIKIKKFDLTRELITLIIYLTFLLLMFKG